MFLEDYKVGRPVEFEGKTYLIENISVKMVLQEVKPITHDIFPFDPDDPVTYAPTFLAIQGEPGDEIFDELELFFKKDEL